MLCGVQLAFEVIMSLPKGSSPQAYLLAEGALKLTRYGVGFSAYSIAIARLGLHHRLQRSDKTMASLAHLIAKLESKIPLQPAPAGV
jgi:hypothetical protein